MLYFCLSSGEFSLILTFWLFVIFIPYLSWFRTGDSRGFAFVRYKYADEAQKAVERLDGSALSLSLSQCLFLWKAIFLYHISSIW